MADVFGLERVEGKQSLAGPSGATWEIDGKGIKIRDRSDRCVECRHYRTSKLKQSAVAALAWTVSDVGASGGIVVTPIGIQQGGEIVAQSTDIEVVRLNADSTTTDYLLQFLDRVLIGASTVRTEAVATLTAEGVVGRAQ